LFPVHLNYRVNACKLVDQTLDRAKKKIEPGLLTFEDLRHVAAQRLDEGDDDNEKDSVLQKAR
jgi:Fe-S-cluster formation regulator IscX/YfhJ